MKVRLAIRVFVDNVMRSEERVEVDPDSLDETLPKLAAKHAAMMAYRPGMIEIEFLDELNPETRFFRVGTDRRGMVNPVKVDPANPEDVLSKWMGPKQ